MRQGEEVGEAASQTATGVDDVGHVFGHGVLGGASNVAMGGKFQDGFLSAAAGAAAAHAGLLGNPDATGPGAVASRTIRAGIIGGTASALGGCKFANGAWTAAFQHLLNDEFRRTFVKPEDVKVEIVSKVIDDKNQILYGLRLSTAGESAYFAFNGNYGILAPRSADIFANYNRALQQRINSIIPGKNALWFKSQVENKGNWDYKQLGKAYQAFGNFNFGFVAHAAGMGKDFSLRGAGLAQWRASTSIPAYGLPGLTGSYGDDPVDQYYIRQGYRAGFNFYSPALSFNP